MVEMRDIIHHYWLFFFGNKYVCQLIMLPSHGLSIPWLHSYSLPARGWPKERLPVFSAWGLLLGAVRGHSRDLEIHHRKARRELDRELLLGRQSTAFLVIVLKLFRWNKFTVFGCSAGAPALQYFFLISFQLQPPAPASRTQWLFRWKKNLLEEKNKSYSIGSDPIFENEKMFHCNKLFRWNKMKKICY